MESLIDEEISVLIEVQGYPSCFSVGVVPAVDGVGRGESDGVVIFAVSDLIDLV